MIRVSPCYFGTIVLLRVSELHTMRIFAYTSTTWGKWSHVGDCQLEGKLAKLNIEEAKIRRFKGA